MQHLKPTGTEKVYQIVWDEIIYELEDSTGDKIWSEVNLEIFSKTYNALLAEVSISIPDYEA